MEKFKVDTTKKINPNDENVWGYDQLVDVRDGKFFVSCKLLPYVGWELMVFDFSDDEDWGDIYMIRPVDEEAALKAFKNVVLRIKLLGNVESVYNWIQEVEDNV